ncbi:hypothetical protein TEA_017238 [Camellia sinensis var. sinensis]|uniref:Uncharacterized protein n=1 Tax=Camellia sinensis var. sinensis TaxID=542762 RepID=A0A4V6RYN7_CAMSN|nr:hypothetical protein TEA_017238 [Camellia sinensis var. sinensis]
MASLVCCDSYIVDWPLDFRSDHGLVLVLRTGMKNEGEGQWLPQAMPCSGFEIEHELKEWEVAANEKSLQYPPAQDHFYALYSQFKQHANNAELMRTLSSLELPRAVAVATAPSSPISNGGPPPYENQERTEKLSLVTTFARETTSQLFRDSNSDVFGANERRNHDQTPHPYPSIVASNDVEEVPNEIPIASDPLEDKETEPRKKARGDCLGEFLKERKGITGGIVLTLGARSTVKKESWTVLILAYQSLGVSSLVIGALDRVALRVRILVMIATS